MFANCSHLKLSRKELCMRCIMLRKHKAISGKSRVQIQHKGNNLVTLLGAYLFECFLESTDTPHLKGDRKQQLGQLRQKDSRRCAAVDTRKKNEGVICRRL